MKDTQPPAKSIPLLAGSLLTLIILLLIHRDFPYVGIDYRYFVPRLIDTNLHLKFNGLSIQWYTPSFGGGLPAYPNPQNLEYSLVQWASYFLGPWAAILLTTAAISLFGYHYFYKLLQEKIGLGWKASTLGAMFFLGNGFYIEHMIVGHLGYQLFPLGSIILFLFLDTKNRIITSAIVIALLLTMMIHQAGFYLIVILFLSYALSLLATGLIRPQLIVLYRVLSIAALAVIIAILISGSKIFAIYSFMQQFPRHMTDVFHIGIAQAMIGLVTQFLGVMTTAPAMFISGQNVDLLSGALRNSTGSNYGIWETDVSISPVLIVFLLIGFARALAGIHPKNKSRSETSKITALLLLIVCWISLELTFAKGLFFSLAKDLPIFSSLHVNVRFASLFIMPLVICGAFLMEGFFQQKTDIRVFGALCFLTLAALSSYFLFSRETQVRDFVVSSAQDIQGGKLYEITEIAPISDWEVFVKNASSYETYEPIFGYQLQNFKPVTHPGSVFEKDNGYLNMTNPASLVFPRINNLQPFERFKVSERDKLKLFVERGQPGWQIPKIQTILNYLSLITLVLCLSVLFINAGVNARAKR